MKICFFGDSLVAGFPFEERCSWADIAANRLNISYTNSGVCGNTTDDLLDRVHIELTDDEITHMIILAGANDIIYRCPTKVIVANLQKIANHAIARGVKVIYALPFLSIDEEFTKRLTAQREAMQNLTGAIMLDLQPTSGLIECVDIIHPSIAGYKQLADIAYVQLRDILNNK